jgi:dihydroflavonol-4-reductase
LNGDAAGRRLIAVSHTLWMIEIAEILRTAFPEQASKLPGGELPNFIFRIIALFDERTKGALSDLGTFYEADTAYVKTMTGIDFRAARDSVIETGRYLLDLEHLL